MFRRKSETRDLCNDAFVLATEKQQRRSWTPLILVVLLAVAGYAGKEYFEAQLAPAQRVIELERENAKLRDELELQRMNLSVEQATRAQLEKELSDRSTELNRLSDELKFFKNAQKKP